MRKGSKRNDRRWLAEDGQEWASEFEYRVFEALRSAGHRVRKCGEGDSISYTESKRNTVCLECGSSQCVQYRTYTPDIFCVPKRLPESKGFYIEVKGYFRAEKRRLFQSMRASNPNCDLRVIFQSNFKATKTMRISQYFDRYLKTTPYHIWDGDLPGEWK